MSDTEKPRILMFAPHCYPPADAESIVAAKLVLAARDTSWRINVITRQDVSTFYPRDGDSSWDAVKQASISIRTKHSLGWAVKAFQTARILLRSGTYDYIFSRVSPQYGHLPALLCSYFFDTPWIAHWSDPMPPVKAPPPFGRGAAAMPSFPLRSYFSLVARRASWHVFPSARLRQYVCSYLPECASKSSVIPHLALERLRVRPEVPSDGFTLCHAGGLGLRNPNVFLEGVKLFLSRNTLDHPMSLIFVGSYEEGLPEIVNKFGLKELTSIEKPKGYQDTIMTLSRSTVAVVIEAPTGEGIFFPSKFVDYVQAGRPILAVSPVPGTLCDILSSSGGGVAVDCRSPVEVAKGVQKLYDAWKQGKLDEKYGSSRLFELYGERAVLGMYLNLLRQLKD